MAKRREKPELTGVAAEAERAADANGMCVVTALIDGVKDNGNTYDAGEELHMHKHLVPVHVAAGQVELQGTRDQGPGTRDGEKQQGTPRDKQAGTPVNK